MLNFIKRNKLLSILLLITIITFIIGIFLYAVLDNNIKTEITNNLNNLINQIKDNKLFKSDISKNIIINNISLPTIIWILGISIIGIPIIIFIYIIKVLILSLETIYLITNINHINILFIINYLIPNIINLFIYFILTYYSINYSYILIKTLFLKKDYNLKIITKRYIKVLIVLLISLIVTSLIEILIVLKVLKIFI